MIISIWVKSIDRLYKVYAEVYIYIYVSQTLQPVRIHVHSVHNVSGVFDIYICIHTHIHIH